MRQTMKKLFALLVALVLAGCNTVRGFGKDVQKVGQASKSAGGTTRSATASWKNSPYTKAWWRRWTATTSTPTRSFPSSS